MVSAIAHPSSGMETLEVLALIAEVAAAESIDPVLFKRLVWVESTWEPKALGAVGEIGLGQINPKYAKWYVWTYATDACHAIGIESSGDLTQEIAEEILWDPLINLHIAARHLRYLYTEGPCTKESWLWSLAAYNWGYGNVERHREKYDDGVAQIVLPFFVRRYVGRVLLALNL